MIKKSLLDKIPFFKTFTDEEKEEISQLADAQFVKFATNESIINEGEFGDIFYIMLQGLAKVYKKPFMEPIADLKPGSIFGEIAFLSPRVRTTSVISMADTFLLKFPKSILKILTPDTRDKLKDQLIIVLIKHLDGLRQAIERTKAPPPVEQSSNPFEEFKKAEEEEREDVIYEDDDGLKLTYLGRKKVRMEKDNKATEVELVTLSETIPGKYIKAIQSAGKDPRDFMYGREFVLPRPAARAWNQLMVTVSNEALVRQRQIDAYQKIDGLYTA
ncbi:MAG: cyclic nucleotide-binding domain-containing protein [Magnetococcales bacterium]|nr:cyclic nucleotide-binding domain-containing protein [Magnetococcales bacterium]MBF0322003.1 cyclic nucleotide-binding domain-containing protein [Magnetococcales bacterium]